MKIIMSHEYADLLKNGINKTIENEAKELFFPRFLGILLTGKGVKR